MEVCGSIDDLLQFVYLPERDAGWSMMETLEAFEDAFQRSRRFKSHTSVNGINLVMSLTNKLKEWVQR